MEAKPFLLITLKIRAKAKAVIYIDWVHTDCFVVVVVTLRTNNSRWYGIDNSNVL